MDKTSNLGGLAKIARAADTIQRRLCPKHLRNHQGTKKQPIILLAVVEVAGVAAHRDLTKDEKYDTNLHHI
ncbi:hypothetical protein MIZ03_2401 [Rhodoferax lithotrophicus]|uniref:Uncharacterized protein n=1 Tax=Rhodoferax lithotrophicus TaxID=2798804 RepID=A0ABM7MML8_9BURK|nr:hypothetical protein [Rhodoferax sp. MIZ03]BCO27513.1 hypothetical protein MIZ03_2401 [Rhodoferax sp. MIZ03]